MVSLSSQEGSPSWTKPLTALILCPTRELALQVSNSLSTLIKACSPYSSDGKKVHPFALITTLCGGLSLQKQLRQLTQHKGPDIVVATPGRFWEIIKEDDEFAEKVKRVKCLVVDEADRMIEVGHFKEMEGILGMVRREDEEPSSSDEAEGNWNGIELDDVGERPNLAFNVGKKRKTKASEDGPRKDMQTLIFSATLSKDLQKNLNRKKFDKKGKGKKKKGVEGEKESTIEELMMKIDFRDEDPLVVDLSPEKGLAENVGECKVECLGEEKVSCFSWIGLGVGGRWEGSTLQKGGSIKEKPKAAPTQVDNEMKEIIILIKFHLPN